MTWLIPSTLAFMLGVLCCGILIPQILLVALKRRLFDEPDERKIHHRPIPRLGGFAFTPVILFTTALICGLVGLNLMPVRLFTGINGVSLSFGICALLLLYIVGLADDLVGVRYRAKFCVQVVCMLLLVVGGLHINNMYGVFGLHEISPWLGIPLTVICGVYVINAINLIDGIDGLASGLSAAAFIVYGLIFGFIGRPLYSLISFAALGVLVPFFYYNVFGRPENGKKIFMGDTGSLTTGLILTFLALEIVCKAPNRIGADSVNPVVIALAPLIIPCFDVTRVFLHRILHRHNPFLPDKNHIHHKLLALGIPQRVAMLIIVLVALIFNVSNILLSRHIEVNLLLLCDIVVWTLANMWLTQLIKKRHGYNPGDRERQQQERT